MLILELDRQLAGHLAVAIRFYRATMHSAGRTYPPGLAELENLAVRVLKNEQECAGVSTAEHDDFGDPYARSDDRPYLTPTEYARAMSVRVGTVYRWVRRGQLSAVRVGRTIRIPRKEPT